MAGAALRRRRYAPLGRPDDGRPYNLFCLPARGHLPRRPRLGVGRPGDPALQLRTRTVPPADVPDAAGAWPCGSARRQHACRRALQRCPYLRPAARKATTLCNRSGNLVASGTFLASAYDPAGGATTAPAGLVGVLRSSSDAPPANTAGSVTANFTLSAGRHYLAHVSTLCRWCSAMPSREQSCRSTIELRRPLPPSRTVTSSARCWRSPPERSCRPNYGWT